MNCPTLAELAAGCQKPYHRTRGNWYARRVARPSAVLGTWLCIRLGVSAHFVTALAWLSGLAACMTLGCGWWLLGALLLQWWYFLDHVDGQVARWKRSESLDGVQFDYLMHHSLTLLVPVAIGWGAAAAVDDRLWNALGLAWGSGSLLLKLCDDSRYKALFQRLKRLHGEFRVVGGALGPTAVIDETKPWWRRFLRASRIALEMHVVINVLSLIGVISLCADGVARSLVCGLLVYGATAEPMIFLVQLVRGLQRESAEQEFKRWFRLPPGATVRVEQGDWFIEAAECDARLPLLLTAELPAPSVESRGSAAAR